MQLLLILALLLCGGAQDMVDEVKPVIREIGGEEAEKAFDEAQKITEILKAAQNIPHDAVARENPTDILKNQPETYEKAQPDRGDGAGLALAPVVGIADGDIVCSLTKYLSA